MALLPSLPDTALDPELALAFFLPPLLMGSLVPQDAALGFVVAAASARPWAGRWRGRGFIGARGWTTRGRGWRVAPA